MMGPRRWVGWMARLLPVLLTGMHFLLITPEAPARSVAFDPSIAAVVSSPEESLPLPVHDETTCAFCQAGAFAPHTSRAVGTLAINGGDEQRVQLAQRTHLPRSGSARPPRSRAPPVIRS